MLAGASPGAIAACEQLAGILRTALLPIVVTLLEVLRVRYGTGHDVPRLIVESAGRRVRLAPIISLDDSTTKVLDKVGSALAGTGCAVDALPTATVYRIELTLPPLSTAAVQPRVLVFHLHTGGDEAALDVEPR